MKNYFLYLLIGVAFIALMAMFFPKVQRKNVNMCGQTMAEANDSINWHNGIYSPDGCVIIKQ